MAIKLASAMAIGVASSSVSMPLSMEKEPSEMSESSSEGAEMSAPDFAANCKRFVEIAGERSVWRGNIKAAIAQAAHVLGIKPRRAKAFYYMEARVIPVNEYYALKAVAERIERLKTETGNLNASLHQMALPLRHVAPCPDRAANGEPRHGGTTHQETLEAGDQCAGRNVRTDGAGG